MSIKIQNFRSSVAGQTPTGLLPGEIAFNLADNYIFLGNGGDTNYDINGNPLPDLPPVGKGWRVFPLTDAVGGVTKLNAGTNVTLSPADGLGSVTINATVPTVPAATPTVRGTVFGYYDSLNSNVGFGPNVLQAASEGCSFNVGVGANTFDALAGGQRNTAVGIGACGSLTSGSNNSCLGNNAGSSLTTGNFNTIVGSGAGSSFNGQQSVFIGYQAGQSGANQSTCVGYNAGRTTTGLNNTLIGNSAGSFITTGAANTIVGPYIGSTTLSGNVILSDGNGNVRFQANASGAVSLGAGGQFGNAGQVFTSGGSGSPAGWSDPAAVKTTGVIADTGLPINIYTTTIPNNGIFSAWGYLTVYSGADVIQTYTLSFLNTYNSFTGMAGPGGVITAGASYSNPTAPEPRPSISVQYGTGQGGGVVSLYAIANNGAFTYSLILFRTV